MASPRPADLLGLFVRIAPAAWFEKFTPARGPGSRHGIYSFGVVTWLMIVQHLHPKGTLGSALQHLLQHWPAPLLPPCKRVRDQRISSCVGGYWQARQKLPILVASQVTDHVLEQLQAALPACPANCSQPVFLLDGSSLELEHTADLIAAYPLLKNQFGPVHWPILKIVVAHNLANGLAMRPSWGPMYGPHAVSEQALAEQVMRRLPQNAVVVGDRNFGVFSTAYSAHQKGLSVLLRLTKERCQRLLGAPGVCGQDQAVSWLPSRDDRRRHPDYHAEAAVPGRILVAQLLSDDKVELLYLFTNLDLAAEQILEMYRCRWQVETDLRSLKNTIHLQHIKARTVDSMEKELLMAITAYNLVRAVMGLAAEQSQISPRSLSFSQVQDVVMAALPVLAAAAADDSHYARVFQRMLHYAARCRLPKRSQRRSFPRLIWGHRRSFPKRKSLLLPLEQKTI